MSLICQVLCGNAGKIMGLHPIVKNVKCGGYFKLTSKINGTKTCYTGSPNTTENSTNGKNSIDKEKYLQDIIAAQNKMIEGRDWILKAEAAWETIHEHMDVMKKRKGEIYECI